jgi:hypothetical protein
MGSEVDTLDRFLTSFDECVYIEWGAKTERATPD